MARTNDTEALAGKLLAAGLFLATTLASQWLQHHLQSQDELDDEIISESDDDSSYKRHHRLRVQRQRMRRQRELQNPQPRQYTKQKILTSTTKGEEEVDDGYEDDEDPTDGDSRQVGFRDYYKLRRINDRLSFENLRSLIEAGADHPYFENQTQEQQYNAQFTTTLLPTGAASKVASRKHKSHQREKVRRVASAVDREDEYDYLPKRSNWSHFEHFNEDDVQRGVVVPGPSPSGTNHHYQAFSNGYNKDYANENLEENHRIDNVETIQAEDVEVSESSEEAQFVWMEAVRRTSKSAAELTASLEASDPINSGLPHDAAPLDAMNATRRANSGGRPSGLTLGDSQATLPTANISPLPTVHNGTSSTLSPDCNGRRIMLRHANSLGTTDSTPDAKWLPQRFVPPDGPMLQRFSSAGGMSNTSSEMSASSEQPRNDQSNIQGSYSDDIVSSSHRSARAQYNAKIMPNKVVMVRHGQSMGNIDEDLYSTTPDNAMPLTKLGWDQARKAGQHLKNKVLAPLESVHFIVSPYARTVETFHGIVSAWCDPDSPEFASIPNREMRLKAWYGRLLEMGLTWHEDPRIREQDFGNYQDPELIRKAKKDRHRFGTFYYRFPHGESASDVFDRVSTFLDSLWRSFDMNRARNYVLVTHGISIRVLLARYFRYTIHQFNMLSNPRNCEMVVLNHDGCGRLRLQGRCQLHLKEMQAEGDDDNGEKKDKILVVDEYKFYRRLRILPQAAIRKVPIRISYTDGATQDKEEVCSKSILS